MFKRTITYLNEMFPLASVISGFLLAVAYHLALLFLNRADFALPLSFYCSAATLVLLTLLLRIMDEFKDYEDDLTNFPDRPLPSGKVQHADLRTLMTLVILAIVALNLIDQEMLVGAVVCLVFSWLMFKWFFMEQVMRRSLPLALVTHHPIVYLQYLYLTLAYISSGQPFEPITAAICIPMGFAVTNWEFSRKLRSPDEESDYTTYTKIWGLKPAAAVTISTQLITLVGLEIYLYYTSTPIWYSVAFALCYVGLMLPYFRFFHTARHALPMKDYSQRMALFVLLTILIHYGLFHTRVG
ncbi:MAG: hypothetical protein AAF492_27830 [Verrucomicrobiota bacterium]